MNTIGSKKQMINTKGLKLPQKRSLNLPRKSDDLSAKWFYIDAEGKECGPFSVGAIRKLIKPNTYVWREGMSEWAYAAETELIKSGSAPRIPSGSNVATSVSYEEPKQEQSVLWSLIAVAIVCVLGYGAFYGFDYVMGIVDEIKEDVAISSGTANQEAFDRKHAETPESFCGVIFGEEIELRFPNVKKRDNTNARTSEYSYWYAPLTLGTPFRNFKDGTVFASMFSKKIYKVELKYKFPRGVSAKVDEAEYKGTLAALKQKYRVGDVENEGWGGDKTHKFRIGNVMITLKFTTEGVIDDGELELIAENLEFANMAHAECEKYYQERSKMDVENMKGFQNNGVDAL